MPFFKENKNTHPLGLLVITGKVLAQTDKPSIAARWRTVGNYWPSGPRKLPEESIWEF